MADGKGMMATVATLLLLSGLLGRLAAATTYTVGGAAGWTFENSTFYDKQFSNITLYTGDSLLFPFDSAYHNVYEVTLAHLDACNTNSPLQTHETSNATVLLSTAGPHNFICGKPTHCAQGMHLRVTVLDSGSASDVLPSPASPPQTPGNDGDELRPQLILILCSLVAALFL